MVISHSRREKNIKNIKEKPPSHPDTTTISRFNYRLEPFQDKLTSRTTCDASRSTGKKTVFTVYELCWKEAQLFFPFACVQKLRNCLSRGIDLLCNYQKQFTSAHQGHAHLRKAGSKCRKASNSLRPHTEHMNTLRKRFILYSQNTVIYSPNLQRNSKFRL